MSDEQTADKLDNAGPLLYGLATIGERGQIVIPAEARKKLSLNPGDRLVVVGHHFRGGLVLFKAEHVESMLHETIEGLSRLKQELPEQGESDHP